MVKKNALWPALSLLVVYTLLGFISAVLMCIKCIYLFFFIVIDLLCFLLIPREYEGKGLEMDALQFKHVIMQALTEVFGKVQTFRIYILPCEPDISSEYFKAKS